MRSKARITLLTAGLLLSMLGLFNFIPEPLPDLRGGSDAVPRRAYVQLFIGLGFVTLGVLAGLISKRKAEPRPESTSDKDAVP
jgi:hypothetical protein